MQKGFIQFLIIPLVLIGLAVVYGIYWYTGSILNQKPEIASFEQCVKDGNPVLQTYPQRCKTKDGKTFVQKLSPEQQKNLQPPTATSSASLDGTANWKIYTNKTYGYTVKYPSDWYGAYQNKQVATDDSSISINKYYDDRSMVIKGNIGFGITIIKLTKSFTQFIKDKEAETVPHTITVDGREVQAQSAPIISKTTITVDGIQGLKLVTEGEGRVAIIYLPKGGYIYTMGFDYRNDLQSLNDQILSTFKFTE